MATLLWVGYAVMQSANRFVRTADDAARVNRIITTIHEMDSTLTRAESEHRGFIVTGDKAFLSSFDEVSSDMARHFRVLRALEFNRPEVARLVDEAEELAELKIREMRKVLLLGDLVGQESARREVATQRGLRLMGDFRQALAKLEAREREMLRRNDLANRANRSEARWFLFLGLGFAILTVALAMGTVLRDARKRFEAEARLQESLTLQNAIFDSANAAIFAFDADGRITSFNRTAERWLGYSADQVVGKLRPAAFHEPRELQELARLRGVAGDAMAALTAGPRNHEREERRWTLVRKDRSSFPAIVSYSVLQGAQGEAAGYVGVATDLTEIEEARKALDAYVAKLEDARSALAAQNDALERAAAELKESRDVALAATRLKSEFLANMSHEIRTPMNGVLGMAHLLLQTNLSERQRSYVRTMQQSAESLLTILNDILDLSKMEAGKMTLEHFPFDVRTTMEDLAESVAPIAQAKGLELGCYVPPHIPVAVVGDAGRLRQIVTNLLSNAIKFTEEGEVVLSVHMVRSSRERVVYRFSVRDTGIGIARDRQERIFESFTQADGSTTRRFGGTGLGLTISRQLCELMGGEIGVHSQLGVGSEFWAEIPFVLREVTEEGSREGLRGKRFLVADDNATNRTIVRELLSAWGCEVDEVATGEDTIRAFSEDPDKYGAVVLDMHMPEMDGVRTAQILRDRFPDRSLPILLLSSIGYREEEVENRRLFKAVLSKPVRSQALYETLLMLVGGGSIGGEAELPMPRVAMPGLRVLVVEDNAVNQLVVVEMLAGWECDPVTAENGAVALDMIRRGERFDLILMDVQMPVMDGLEATRAIRAHERAHGGHVPILAMTANAMSGDRERCLNAGMDGYLSKPLQASELLARLTSHVPPPFEGVAPRETAMSTDLPLLDVDRLNEACRGKAPLRRKIVERFVPTSTRSLEQMEAAAHAGDAEALRAAAHALKGSSLTVGSPLVARLCESIEHAARDGAIDRASIGAVRPHLLRLHEELTGLLAGLEAQP